MKKLHKILLFTISNEYIWTKKKYFHAWVSKGVHDSGTTLVSWERKEHHVGVYAKNPSRILELLNKNCCKVNATFISLREQIQHPS